MSLPIGFFSPLPLPIMVPFMFMQSAAMALGFGSFFQYGKRKISSMSNDDFNVLTPEALTADLMSSVNNMIPTVQQSFHQMETMNVMILEAMAKYFDQAVTFLEKWIQGGFQGFQQNIQSGITDPLDDFIKSGGQLLPGAGAEDFIPQAGGTQTGKQPQTAVEIFASKWMTQTHFNPAGMTQAIAKYLLGQISAGNLDLYKIHRTSLIKHMDSFNVAPLTPKQIFTQTTNAIANISTGLVKQIADKFALLKFRVSVLIKLQGNKSQLFQFNSNMKAFLIEMKAYNVFVAINGHSNLQVDTAKSMAQLKLVPKL